jgi:hypothetical protein
MVAARLRRRGWDLRGEARVFDHSLSSRLQRDNALEGVKNLLHVVL